MAYEVPGSDDKVLTPITRGLALLGSSDKGMNLLQHGINLLWRVSEAGCQPDMRHGIGCNGCDDPTLAQAQHGR
jgi:hypothetical protein